MMQIKLICHDCKHELVENEEYMTYPGTDKIKCKQCHQQKPELRDFRECECYSRVCGYIRPISQWNPGKVSEHKDKKYYKIEK